ncbi:hypothetical protein H4R20_003608 [Coemansia guatemalensis]|uniref:SET domain-containing protein n=1 Tax=Coemansia guatemalensis TaxID=2761395 RepID=A0A9W8LTW9_9FUNG|nr:hypothetical protein H4R20_003608 [Coemansia guatemalensis]
MKVLVEKDWPVCFGPEPTSNDCLQQSSQITSADDCLGKPQAPDVAADIHLNVQNADAAQQPLAKCAEECLSRCTGMNNSNPTIQNVTAEQSDQPDGIDIPKNWNEIVQVRSSTIPNAGNGLFAVRDLPGGIPIGFYFGVPMTEDEFDSLKEPVGLSSHYSIMYRKTVLDATDENGMPYTDPNGPLYCPFHFMNEARESDAGDASSRCNITFLEGVVVNQIICLTTRNIKKGEELFVSYGSEVDRSHWDGKDTGHSEVETQQVDLKSTGDAVLSMKQERDDLSQGFAAPKTIAMRAAPVSADIECHSASNTSPATQKQGIVHMLKTLATSASASVEK